MVLSLIIAFNLIWSLILSLVLFQAYRTYKKLTHGASQKNLVQSLIQIKDQCHRIDKDLDDFRSVLRDTHQSLKTHIQKVGFIRFNPFGNTGGDQSFCLCLLDSLDNGILITSLHARDQTRIYTKQIKKGNPTDKNSLSKEEIKCLQQAVKGGAKS